MAKDPAFSFYSQDFLTGTIYMTDEQVGIYVRLLIVQHQLGGLINKEFLMDKVGNHKIVLDKFIEVDEGFYNARLMKEMVKREKKSTNLSANAKKRWMQNESKSNANAYTDLMQLHKPIEIENENIVITKELYEKICENILDQKEFWLMIFKATKIPAERAQELFKTFSYEQGCIEYRTATELKKHFTNWIKIESKKDNHEQPQKFNGKF